MNKLFWRGNRVLYFWEESRILFRRNFMKDDDKDKVKELEIEDRYKARKGLLHDKQQSPREESFFHKEEIEQLKALKEKVKKRENEKTEEKD